MYRFKESFDTSFIKKYKLISPNNTESNLLYWITSVIHWISFVVGKQQCVSQFMSSFQTKLPLKNSIVKIGRIKLTDLFS